MQPLGAVVRHAIGEEAGAILGGNDVEALLEAQLGCLADGYADERAGRGIIDRLVP
jgi:hypothetical protein